MSKLIFVQLINGTINGPDEKRFKQVHTLNEIQIYQLDGQTCRLSEKEALGESEEKVDDASRCKIRLINI